MRKGVLSDEETFRFDLQGYLVVPAVLTRAECDDLSRLADAVWPRQPDDGAFRRTASVSQWGKAFLDLMDHPKVLPYLIELIGGRLRIDHDYSIFMQKGAEANKLHGGPRLVETDHWYYYSDGVMRNGLTVATWNLTDAPQGAGGFVCIPGSHKTHFLKQLPDDVRRLERWPDYVYQPPMQAGLPSHYDEGVGQLLRYCSKLRDSGDLAMAAGMCGRACCPREARVPGSAFGTRTQLAFAGPRVVSRDRARAAA